MKKYIFTLSFAFMQMFASEKPLIVGTTSGYAPYVSLNEKGEYEGFDIDFANELAQKLGRKLVIKDLGSMPSLMLALEQSKIDLIVWAVSITEEREKKFNMIYYQGKKVTEIPVIFAKELPEKIKNLEDLAPYRLVVEGGSFQEGILRSYPKISFQQIDSVTDALLAVRYGKSEGALVDPSLINELTNRFSDIKVRYFPLKKENYSLGNGVCINKKEEALTLAVKNAIEELEKEGKIALLEKKWKLEE